MRTDREVLESALSLIASISPEDGDDFSAAYEACLQRGDAAGTADLAVDVADYLTDEDREAEANAVRHWFGV